MRTTTTVLAGVAIATTLGIVWEIASPGRSGTQPESIQAASQVRPGPTDSISESFAVYDRIRSFLAEDQIGGLMEEAERLSEAAGRAADRSKESLKSHFEVATKAAGKLKEAKGLAEARMAFGDVSRAFVQIPRADTTLAGTRYVYRCPMVKQGYASWVQAQKEISNPYMGKAMARCGVSVDSRE